MWLLGRLAWLLPISPEVCCFRTAFLAIVGWVLGRDLVAAGKRENYPMR